MNTSERKKEDSKRVRERKNENERANREETTIENVYSVVKSNPDDKVKSYGRIVLKCQAHNYDKYPLDIFLHCFPRSLAPNVSYMMPFTCGCFVYFLLLPVPVSRSLSLAFSWFAFHHRCCLCNFEIRIVINRNIDCVYVCCVYFVRLCKVGLILIFSCCYAVAVDDVAAAIAPFDEHLNDSPFPSRHYIHTSTQYVQSYIYTLAVCI